LVIDNNKNLGSYSVLQTHKGSVGVDRRLIRHPWRLIAMLAAERFPRKARFDTKTFGCLRFDLKRWHAIDIGACGVEPTDLSPSTSRAGC
jgi:hypothetical protein